jgi:hypothetical protein
MAKKLENIVHNNLGHILSSSPRQNIKSGLYSLKNSSNFFAKCQTVDRLLSVSPSFNRWIFGNPLPTAIETIGASANNFFTKDLMTELDWFSVTIRKYYTEINLFLNFKKEFENQFLLGNYKIALREIENLENAIGHSIWSLSARFLVYEYTGNQEKSKLLQNELFETNLKGVFTSSLVGFISQRSERKLSAHRFDEDLSAALNNPRTNLDNANRDYYKFQLNFFEQDRFDELKDIVGFDYYNPVVDRYLTFRKLVLFCFSNSFRIQELLERLKFIQKKVDDDIFNTINLFFSPDFKKNTFYDDDYLKVIDQYYAGLYDEACESAAGMIAAGDADFNLINLYSRSLALNKVPYSLIIDSPSLVNEIGENIYKIYKRSSNPAEALYSLYQISKNIDSFDINFQLNSYVKIEQGSKTKNQYMYLAGKKADPIITELFRDNKTQAQFALEKLAANTSSSIAVNYRLKMLNNDLDKASGISVGKLKIDTAKSLYLRKAYPKALVLWKEIFIDYNDSVPVLEASIDYIFRLLVETGEYDQAIDWYVDSAIKNPYLVYKIETVYLHQVLKKGRFKNVSITIQLAIFISLVSNDENEKSFAIEMYCKSKGAQFPSELSSQEDFSFDEYVELFYFFCCNSETLKYYKHLNTTKKRLDERITICNVLATNYQIGNENYVQELNLLTNELIIHEGTQKLDESKIYANDQAILKKELDEYEGLYNRYMTLASLFLKNVKILTINKNELRFLDKKGEIEYTQNEIEYSKNADIDSFGNIFDVVREKFLFSKFGIVTYLSTRIRHGVLLGELRPELEKFNLIFFKNKLRDKYEPNDHWIKNSLLTQNEKNNLIHSITVFSEKIDDLINLIIKENIQIKLHG